MDENIVIKVKILNSSATIPTFAHMGDACADLYADVDVRLDPSTTQLISTGIALQIPKGYEGLIRPRSGLSLKQSVIIVNSPGTIDSGYRGELKIIMHNLGTKPFEVCKGDRIAQLAIRKIPNIKFDEVEELEDTPRGAGGFGSTGS
jgi:dUTP pyrophosphatase